MRLDNLFESNHPTKLYESYQSFIKDNNNEKLLKEAVESNVTNVMNKHYNDSIMARLIMDDLKDDIYAFWKANGKGLPKGFGTEQAFNEYKSWIKSTLRLDETTQEIYLQRLFEAKQDFINMFSVIDEAVSLVHSLDDGKEKDNFSGKLHEGQALLQSMMKYKNSGEFFLKNLQSYFDRSKTNYIIFFLRMYKGLILKVWMENGAVDIIEEKDPQLAKKIHKQLSVLKGQIQDLQTGVTFNTIKMFIRNITHYLSFDYEPIQQLNPLNYKSYASLKQDLDQLEEEWREQLEEEKRYLKLQDGDEIFKDYGKYVWIKLDRSRCEDEAEAMGHCGNQPAGDTDARILSFREKVEKDEQILYKPHLTFILDENGYLGEMKGYANDKPSEKYHPYIIDLLQMDMVKGIAGGGWEPQNNFQMTDLDEDTREKLVEQKPTLEPIKYYEDSMKENGYVANNEILDVITEHLEQEYDIQVKPMYALGYVAINMDLNDDTLQASEDTTLLIDILNGENDEAWVNAFDSIDPMYNERDFREILEVIQEDNSEVYETIQNKVYNFFDKLNEIDNRLIDVFFSTYRGFYEDYNTNDLAEFLYDIDYGTIDGDVISNEISDEDDIELSKEQLIFIENTIETFNDDFVMPIKRAFTDIAWHNSQEISFNKLKKEIHDELHFATLPDDELRQLTSSLINDGELYEVPIQSIEEIENEGMVVELDVSFYEENIINSSLIQEHRDIIDVDIAT